MIFASVLFSLLVQTTGTDCAVVMLHGVPAEPWASLSELQLEEMWTYGIEGYQVTRSAWSGYILRGPEGSGDLLESICATLAADSTIPDSSLWARTLQLVWDGNALPGYAVIEDTLPEIRDLPVRTSRWLEAGEDTLMLSLPVENTVLLWAGGYSGDFSASAWRGVGTEVIPFSGSRVNALVSWTIQGSPGDIIDLEYHPLELDAVWEGTWAPVLAMADSIVARRASLPARSMNSLVWIRGTGGSRMSPWGMVPSPSPRPVASVEVESRPGIVPLFEYHEIPGVLTVTLPGNAGSASRAAYAAALLERILARMILPPEASLIADYTPSGEVRLHFSGTDWTESQVMDVIHSELLPVIFTSPEAALMHNAAIRASIPPLNQRDTIELLAVVAGFLN
jgi:hypothetical protein